MINKERRSRSHLVYLAIGAALLAGCATKPLNVAYNPPGFVAPDPVPVAKTPDIIGAGDKIKVTVFDVDALSGEFQVEENGELDFPLIGAVDAQGRSPAQLAKVLADRLGEKNLRNPNVHVELLASAQQTITVEGAVNQAGVIPVPGPLTLIQAVALGHGTTDTAKLSQVVVFRNIHGQRMAAAFDLKAIQRAEAPDPTIYPNDIVVVGGSQADRTFAKVLQTVSALGVFRPF